MESFANSLRETQEAVDELATSVRMSKVRRAAQPIEKRDELPDPYKSPDAWRDAINGRLGRAMIPK